MVPIFFYAKKIRIRRQRLMKYAVPGIGEIPGIGGRNDGKPVVPQYEHELDLRSSRGEVLPAYADSVQSEIGPMAVPESHV